MNETKPAVDRDVIIVGGGTAGCVLANRLSADASRKVMLVEAGPPDDSMWIPIPVGFTKLMNNQRYNWCFRSEPEPGTRDRAIPVPRGKTLGGSSALNGMIMVRGQPLDYDGWAQLGNRGWSFEDVLPFFQKFEHFEGPRSPLRGSDGPLNVHEVRFRNELTDAFLRAAVAEGFPLNADYNGESQEGFGYMQVNQKDGQRVSAARAYLHPIRGRANLEITTGAQVTRLLFEGRRCTGVEYVRDGERRQVFAHDVILSAGTVQSPQIMELSGLGDPDILNGFGIPVVHGLPGVGRNLRDHYTPRMNWRGKKRVTFNDRAHGVALAMEVAKYYALRRGILTSPSAVIFGFVKTRPELATPDVQFHFNLASFSSHSNRKLDREPGMTIAVYQLRPQSTGTIHIKSPDPLAAPAIRPNFLSDPLDETCLVGGMKIARRIVDNPLMEPYRKSEMNPGSRVQSDEEWLDFARRNGETSYHVAGTCKMGSDPFAVVNERLEVHGIEGLRVVDASIMPTMVSGNTHAATLMIAEKGADLFLKSKSAMH
ncbi:MAG: GMC family oxidoreductase N-terminal domain-containing protein [Rhizobiaceae bacterium]|nr:GMC family oxidoreductase N-terminal domain-containing protein [Rhizobiaceae bacterium]